LSPHFVLCATNSSYKEDIYKIEKEEKLKLREGEKEIK